MNNDSTPDAADQSGPPGRGGPTPEELFEANKPLAIWAVNRYARRRGGYRGADVEDAEQVAFLGLYEAALRFDPSRGIKFATYAASWIFGRLRDHQLDDRLIRIPKYFGDPRRRPEHYVPYAESAARIAAIHRRDGRDIDLIDPKSAGSDATGTRRGDDLARMVEAINSLPPRCATVLRLEMRGLNLHEICQEMDILPYLAKETRKKALHMIRRKLGVRVPA